MKISEFFRSDEYDEDETDYDEEDYRTAQAETQGNGSKVMELVNKNHEKKIMLFEPRIFSDVKAIAQRLLEGQAAVVNFQRIYDGHAQRVGDFLSGVTFAIYGKIQRVGEKIFLCTPDDFIVEGTLTDTRQDDEFKMRGV